MTSRALLLGLVLLLCCLDDFAKSIPAAGYALLMILIAVAALAVIVSGDEI